MSPIRSEPAAGRPRRAVLTAALALALGAPLVLGLGRQPEQPAPAKGGGATIDEVIAAFYDSTSGGPGEARDWERLESLFVNGGRLITVHHGPHGEGTLLILTAQDYTDANRNYFNKSGFVEREIARRTETFGSIAHVLSTFESRRAPQEPDPYARGLYSFQLAHDGARWWIVNAMWERERDESPLPRRYLESE